KISATTPLISIPAPFINVLTLTPTNLFPTAVTIQHTFQTIIHNKRELTLPAQKARGVLPSTITHLTLGSDSHSSSKLLYFKSISAKNQNFHGFEFWVLIKYENGPRFMALRALGRSRVITATPFG